MGDMYAPQLDTREALAVEAAEFVRSIETRAKPLSDGAAGLRVVRLLEAATLSMQQRGNPVEIDDRSVMRDSLSRLTSAVSNDRERNTNGDTVGSELQPVHIR
jgi:hypothetical protein